MSFFEFMGARLYAHGACGEGDINFVDRGKGLKDDRRPPHPHHTAPTVAPRDRWRDLIEAALRRGTAAPRFLAGLAGLKRSGGRSLRGRLVTDAV